MASIMNFRFLILVLIIKLIRFLVG
jgi:hypothetical protein